MASKRLKTESQQPCASLKDLIDSSPSFVVVPSQECPDWSLFEKDIQAVLQKHDVGTVVYASKLLQIGYQLHFVVGPKFKQTDSLSVKSKLKPLTAEQILLMYFKMNPNSIGKTFIGKDGQMYTFDGLGFADDLLPQPQLLYSRVE